MSRLAPNFDIVYWEEPVFVDEAEISMVRSNPVDHVTVVTPHLPSALEHHDVSALLARLVREEIEPTGQPVIRWYYTPMMLPFTHDIAAACTVYDCMDELANFAFAPPELASLEQELMGLADLVFTGGYSLFEAKSKAHANVHAFPSSVDTAHFAQARQVGPDPADQAGRPAPRLGYYGVVDERFDCKLLGRLADLRPDWTFVIVGPVVKIDPETLPRRANIAYLGAKDYSELPAYIRHWDVALMPFVLNDSTKFISPTKTPEYLAAGLPVVSTPVTDVMRHYGELEAVFIATTAEQFAAACERALKLKKAKQATWLVEVDMALSQMSWDLVVADMRALIHDVIERSGEHDNHYDYLVVGAGFAGSVMAERLARGSGKRVLVVDRRDHIAGNAYDRLDEHGVLIHQYGPHIFHTNSPDVFDYLSQFTEWRDYEHRVLADIEGKLVPVPINRTTLNALYDAGLETDEETQAYLDRLAEPTNQILTSEDAVVSKVGRRLYEAFFQGYTRKQWGLDPSQLDKSVAARIPVRTNEDDRYFTDTFQKMPRDGYTAMFERMLDDPRITIVLNTDYSEITKHITYSHLIFTGPIDEYFDHRYGRLPYRSLQFRHETLEQENFQPVGTVNYPAESVPYTRITEFKHLTGQTLPVTSVTYEYPAADGDPYYPIPRPENATLYKRYEALALGTPGVTFVGRLATYRYYNMDQVVGQALAAYRRHIAKAAAAKVEFEVA